MKPWINIKQAYLLALGKIMSSLLCPCCLIQREMSVINLESLSNDELKKRVASLISLGDWSDKCGQYGIPSLLHIGGPCTRKEWEPPDIVIRIWSEFRTCNKPILTVLKSEIRKGTEDSLLLDGLKKLLGWFHYMKLMEEQRPHWWILCSRPWAWIIQRRACSQRGFGLRQRPWTSLDFLLCNFVPGKAVTFRSYISCCQYKVELLLNMVDPETG